MTEPYRVIVIDDDPDVALYTKTVLEKRLGATVVSLAEPTALVEVIHDLEPDLVITDIEMPGISGLDLIARIHATKPGLPVIVMTAHASLDYAVTALRNNASEFLTKPVSSGDLVAHVTRLVEDYRETAKNAAPQQIVLAIGAHPDDVEIGVGGILAAHSAAGDLVTVLTLTRGNREGGIRVAWNESSASAQQLGALLILEDETAGELRSDPAIDVITRVVAQVKPTVVYVHSKNDRNGDHRAVYEAAMIACGDVRTIACYQSSTSTVEFRPNRFVPIDGFLEQKLRMIASFAVGGERARYLDPDIALASARYWSRFAGWVDCEPLEIVRDATVVTQ